MNKFIKRMTTGFLSMSILIGMGIGSKSVYADTHGEYPSGEILALGGDLSDSQKADMRKYFKVSDDMDAIYVTTDVAVKALGLSDEEAKNVTGGWYSSAYVKLNNKETGVKVTAKNLTLVTNDMLANALITSGIYNADVSAYAPFEVTGESALAGILAGAENIMGTNLPKENKEVAQEEIGVSTDLADEVGQTEAAAIINDIKSAVIEQKPKTDKDIKAIVDNIAGEYSVDITEDMEAQIVSLMSKIKNLDIDYSEVKNTLDKTASKLKDELAALGKSLNDSGFFEKVIDWLKNAFEALKDMITGE